MYQYLETWDLIESMKKKAKKQDRKIKVSVETGQKLAYSLLSGLQGDLKETSEESLESLKKSILRHGFTFPMFVWENPEDASIRIIDGHSRLLALESFKEDGYSIPQIPVVFIPAKSLDEAKEKLLVATSQYGDFSQDGVKKFFDSFKKFDPNNVFREIKLPGMKLPAISFAEKTVDVAAHERVLADYSEEEVVDPKLDFRDKCPHCGERL